MPENLPPLLCPRARRDHPRWTVADALPALSAATPGMREPWCARFGRQYSFKWHCRARRQHMTKNRWGIGGRDACGAEEEGRCWTGDGFVGRGDANFWVEEWVGTG